MQLNIVEAAQMSIDFLLLSFGTFLYARRKLDNVWSLPAVYIHWINRESIYVTETHFRS